MMKKTMVLASLIVLLVGGLIVMAFSPQSIKSVERKIEYMQKPILEDIEILDIDGTTYVPLRALCESTRKYVAWDALDNKVIIENEEWEAPEKFEKYRPYIGSMTAIPNAETAFQIADTMFRAKKNEFCYMKAKGTVNDVEYDEKYDAWIVYGEEVWTDNDPNRVGSSDVPIVVVLRKDNGEVIAFW